MFSGKLQVLPGGSKSFRGKTSSPIIQVVFKSTGKPHTVLDLLLVSRLPVVKTVAGQPFTPSACPVMPLLGHVGPCKNQKDGSGGSGDLFEPRGLATPPFCTHLSKRNWLLLDKFSHHSSCLQKHRQATHCFGPFVGESPPSGQNSGRPTIHTALGRPSATLPVPLKKDADAPHATRSCSAPPST